MKGELEAIRTAYNHGDAALALCLARDYLRDNTEDGKGWELLGLIQHARRRYASSVSAFERATTYVPMTAASRVCLAQGYAQIGKTELARDLLADFIGEKSLPAPLLLQVATSLDSIDQPGLAIQACQEASRREPELAQPYYDLGYYAARCGRPARVTENLARKAISLDPANVCYRVGLASHLLRQDRQMDAYEVVQGFTNEQIEQILCRCCLERVVNLFELAGDYRRAAHGREHLLALEIQHRGSDCD